MIDSIITTVFTGTCSIEARLSTFVNDDFVIKYLWIGPHIDLGAGTMRRDYKRIQITRRASDVDIEQGVKRSSMTLQRCIVDVIYANHLEK